MKKTPKESLEQVFWVNSMVPMLQMAALSPHIRSGGAVLVTSSSAIHEAQAGISLYSASKAALHTAALSWATELAPRNIRVNILVPGPITSNLRAAIPDSFEAMLAQNALLKRGAMLPKPPAAMALFLLSDDAGYVTGSAYDVNGGFRP
ncbi:SDR family NAD(P)-dependent oxidoreductase [Neisseria sp.]|uniref:SDR family NAD(P)-dependent oxidoreductase n=1 Tax=Neisseria sp. TaxID=192066 RepID=UPI0035A000E9